MRKGSLFLSLTIYSRVVFIIVLFLFVSSENRLHKEEEAVYAVLLSDTRGTVIIADKTSQGGFMSNDPSSGWINVHNNMPAVSWATWRNYLARNKRSHPLSPDMQLGVKYYLMGEEEMREIFSHKSSGSLNPAEGGWEELRRRYPDSDGITGLSRAGFNIACTEAIVSIGISRASLNAESYLVYLEKQNGIWQIVEQWLFAIS